MNQNLESRRSGRLRGDDPAFQTEDLSVLHRRKSNSADKSPLLATQLIDNTTSELEKLEKKLEINEIDNTTSELEKLEKELEVTTGLNNKETQLEINKTGKESTLEPTGNEIERNLTANESNKEHMESKKK